MHTNLHKDSSTTEQLNNRSDDLRTISAHLFHILMLYDPADF